MPKNHRAEYHLYIDRVRQMIEVDKLTQIQVAVALGKSRSAIGRWCKRYDLETQRTGPRNGELHPEWKGGRKHLGRYLYIYSPDHPNATKQKYVAEHRLVMENKLGRYLLKTEAVHHKDGNPENNHSDNLEVFATNAEHLRHELLGRIPNWSAAGRLAIDAGIRKAAAIHRHIKTDDDLRILSTDHQPK